MLTSLFGDLPRLSGSTPAPRDDETGFAATAVLEALPPGADAGALPAAEDLLVSGSPAQAIRAHFATARADLERASALLTLLDPADIWASGVIRALSDAGGRPIERLQLRDRATLRPLATIERATLVRRQGDMLRICHADVLTPGREHAEIPLALMEASQLSAVIVGPLEHAGLDALLKALQAATLLPSWRCPNLLLMLPANAAWMAQRIEATAWPARLDVAVTREPMSGVSSVWNAMLGFWNKVKAGPAWESPNPTSRFGGLAVGLPPRRTDESAPERSGASALSGAGASVPSGADAALAGMATLDGLLTCALVQTSTGALLARVGPDAAVDLAQVAAGAVVLLQAQRQAARTSGWAEAIDEMLTTAGSRQLIVRPLRRQPALCIVGLLELGRVQLPLVRLRLDAVERVLGETA